MSLTERLALIVDLDPKSAIKGLTSIGTTAEKELSKAEGSGAKFGKTMSHVGVGMIGVGAVIGGALFEMSKKAGEAEFAQIKLDNSIANSAHVSKDSAEEFEKLAKSIQNKTAASRIDIIAGEAQLIQFGATTEQVKGLTPLIVDLAQKQGVDLTTANKMVGKALEGSAGALKKAGIIVDETAYKTDRYKAITDALRRTVGGFAETEGKTFEGSVARLKNQLSDLEAGVGKGAVDAFTKLLGPVETLSADFNNLSPETQSVVGEVGAYAAAGLIAVGATATLIGKVVAAKQNFAEFATSLPKVTTGLGIVAQAALVIGAIDLGSKLSQSINPGPTADVSKLTLSLLDLQHNGGEATKELGQNFNLLAKGVEQVAAPSNATKLEHVFGWLPKTNFDLKDAHTRIGALDQSLTSLQNQDPKAATSVLDAIKSKIGDKSFQELAPLLHGYNDAVAQAGVTSKVASGGVDTLATSEGTAGDAATTAGEDFVKLAGITGKNIDPVKELTGAIDGLVSKFLSVEGTTDSYQKLLNGLVDDVKTAVHDHLKLGDSLLSTSDAAITFRGALRSVVDDGAKVIDSLVQQGASSDQVRAKVKQLSDEFVAQAKAAGVPQPVIDHYLAVLNSIPTLVPTTVTVDTSEALAKLANLRSQYGQVLAMGAVNSSAFYAPGNQPKGSATGGYAEQGSPMGGPRGTDTIPAWLSPGEFVINANAAKTIGPAGLNSLNARHLAGGGYTYANGTQGWVPEGTVFEDGSVAGTSTIERQAAASAEVAAIRRRAQFHRPTPRRESAAHGAGLVVNLNVSVGGEANAPSVVQQLRTYVRTQFGGDVQRALSGAA